MNHYVNWLHDVAKLVYIVGNYDQAVKIKKWLDPSDNKYCLPYPETKFFSGVSNNSPRKLSRRLRSKVPGKASSEPTGSRKPFRK